MSFCPNCGTPFNGNPFCSNCGTPAPASPASATTSSGLKIKGSFFSSAGNVDGSAPKAPSAPTPTPVPPAPAPAPTPVPPAPAPAPAPTPMPAPAPAPMPAPAPHDVPPASAFPPPAPTPSRPRSTRRISAAKELKLLLRQGILVLLGEKRNLIISLLFPFIAAAITVWIAGEDMFNTFESTKSACFILVCAAIWGGLFNSIQSLVKERENIKRDYVSGALRIECYMGSRAIIQFVLCLVQSFVLAMSIPAVEWVHGNSMPSSGLFEGPVMLEFYLSLFLIMFASDALGLLISSIVKKEELASKLAPYILIAQLLFSGVLFKLEGAANILSGIMISRWGMEALGSICNLNDQTTKVYAGMEEEGLTEAVDCACVKMAGMESCPCSTGILESLQHPEFEEAFESTAGHLALVFFIMFLFVAIPLVAADIMLHRVKKDGRD